MMKSQWRVDRNQNTFSARTIICVVLFVKVMAEISDRRNNDFNRLGVPKDLIRVSYANTVLLTIRTNRNRAINNKVTLLTFRSYLRLSWSVLYV